MSEVPVKEAKYSRAAYILGYYLGKPNTLNQHLSEPLAQVLTEEELSFLKRFLACAQVRKSFSLIDNITRSSQSSKVYSDGTVSQTLRPLISKHRPVRLEDRSCLAALNDAWNELESLLIHDEAAANPDVRELHDILSDYHIRELLVAVDDIGQYRYTNFVSADTVCVAVYVEAPPVFVVEEKDASEENDGTLDQLLSVSSLPEDAPFLPKEKRFERPQPTPSSTPGRDPRTAIRPVQTPQLRGSPCLPQRTSSATSATLPLSRKPKTESPQPTSPYHSLGRRRSGGDGGRNRSRFASAPSQYENNLPEPGKVRTIRITRNPSGEPLGITLAEVNPTPTLSPTSSRSESLLSLLGKHSHRDSAKEPSEIVIQRVMVGSLAYRDGQLFQGDVVLEFNGAVANSMETIKLAMKNASQCSQFQLVVRTPSWRHLKAHLVARNPPEQKIYIRCLFTYEPLKDQLIPVGNLGIPFKSGDILELVDAQDLNWWQVRKIDNPNSSVGLIPSQTLEERRQAFNQQAGQSNPTKKSKKIKTIFRAADSSNLLVRSDLWVYEEVIPWPPSPVHTLLLIGPNGVGRRTLKFLLCTKYPQRFAFPVSDTTDPTASSSLFRLRSKDQMENDIRLGAYVEWGTVDAHHYGIRFSAIREIIATGRTALVDCQCQSVHLLHQPEFNPHVVFVSAPGFEAAKSMMETGIRENLTANIRSDEEIQEVVEQSKLFATRQQHLYTHTLVNSNMTESVDKLSCLVSRLEGQKGWIPAGWAYEMGLPKSSGVYIPGLSTSLSDSGIPGLPQDSQSVLGRVTGSVLSTASPESAVRLARPPSVCSSLQLSPPPPPSGRGRDPFVESPSGRWRYEKRATTIQRSEQPQFTPKSTAGLDRVDPKREPLVNRESSKLRLTQTPSKPILRGAGTTSVPHHQKLVPAQVLQTTAPIKPPGYKGNADGEDDISSTSSETE